MSKVVLDISMSLDGFITAPSRRPEEPMGDGGQRLHAWAMGGEGDLNRRLLEDTVAAEGATIAGRETYNTSERLMTMPKAYDQRETERRVTCNETKSTR